MELEKILKLYVVLCYLIAIIFLQIVWTIYILALCAIALFYMYCQNLRINFHF